MHAIDKGNYLETVVWAEGSGRGDDDGTSEDVELSVLSVTCYSASEKCAK